jgi:hypothetical protein
MEKTSEEDRACFEIAANGSPLSCIAKKLNVSAPTVESHIHRFAKTQNPELYYRLTKKSRMPFQYSQGRALPMRKALFDNKAAFLTPPEKTDITPNTHLSALKFFSGRTLNILLDLKITTVSELQAWYQNAVAKYPRCTLRQRAELLHIRGLGPTLLLEIDRFFEKHISLK